jgi:hypothetical protein
MQKIFDEKALFSQRLRVALEAASYGKFKVSDIEREFNLRYVSGSVTPQAIYKWLNGQSIPSFDKIQVLADWLNVSAEWLKTGASNTTLNAQSLIEKQGLESFLQLNNDHKYLILNLMQALLKTYP